MTKREKLEQVNRIFEKHNFYLLSDVSLSEISDNFGNSEYDTYYWNDLCYAKHYGKSNEYVLFVYISTQQDKKYHTKLCLSSRSWFGSNIKTDMCRILPDDIQTEYDKYFLQARRAYNSLERALSKVSIETED